MLLPSSSTCRGCIACRASAMTSYSFVTYTRDGFTKLTRVAPRGPRLLPSPPSFNRCTGTKIFSRVALKRTPKRPLVERRAIKAQRVPANRLLHLLVLRVHPTTLRMPHANASIEHMRREQTQCEELGTSRKRRERVGNTSRNVFSSALEHAGEHRYSKRRQPGGRPCLCTAV